MANRKVTWDFAIENIPSAKALLTNIPLILPEGDSKTIQRGNRDQGGFGTLELSEDDFNLTTTEVQKIVEARLGKKPPKKYVNNWLDDADHASTDMPIQNRSIVRRISLLEGLIKWMAHYVYVTSKNPRPNWGYKDLRREKILGALQAASDADGDLEKEVVNKLGELRIDKKRVSDFAELVKEELDAVNNTYPRALSKYRRKLATLLVLNAYAAREMHPDLSPLKRNDPRLVGPNPKRAASDREGRTKAAQEARKAKAVKDAEMRSEHAKRLIPQLGEPPVRRRRRVKGPPDEAPTKAPAKEAAPEEGGRGKGRGKGGRPKKKGVGPPPEQSEEMKKALPDEALRHVAFRGGAENQERSLLYPEMRKQAKVFLEFMMPSDIIYVDYDVIYRAAGRVGVNIPPQYEKLSQCRRPGATGSKTGGGKGAKRPGTRGNRESVVHEYYTRGRHVCLYFHIKAFRAWLKELFPQGDFPDDGVQAAILATQDFLTDLVNASLAVEKAVTAKNPPQVRAKTVEKLVPDVFGERLTRALHVLGTRDRTIAGQQAAAAPRRRPDEDIIRPLGPTSFAQAQR